MKPVFFVAFFTIGVSLMIFSGYLPQSASARGNGAGPATASGDSGIGSGLFDRQPIAGTVTRKVETAVRDAEAEQSDVRPAVVTTVYTESPPTVAENSSSESASTAQPAKAAEPVVPVSPLVEEPASKPEVPASEPPTELVSDAKSEPLVLADAGPDRVVWIGWDELTLDATGSTGENLTYKWTLLSGPSTLVIKNDRLAITTASGLLAGEKPRWGNIVCKFELTATDPSGVQDTTTVRYVVKSAPMLKIKPMADRRFELRDGYELGHFTAWATNVDSYESVFEISSETELTFTKVAGSAYAMTGGKAEKNFVYQITVYGQDGESTSWVELLVDTDERIPGIVRLGVNWEGR